MWNAISSGLQAVQDRLDNVIDTQDISQSEKTNADETDVSQPLPPVVGGADNDEEVKFIAPHNYIILKYVLEYSNCVCYNVNDHILMFRGVLFN